MFIKACRNLRTIASAAAMLAATAATAAQTANADATTARQCLGTEPFWSLTLDGKTIKFENFGTESSLSIKQPTPRSANGRTSEYLAMYQGRTLETPSRFLNVIIRNQSCSDGMSDETYPYSVLVLSGNDLFDGCCL
jgi:uncharacterized membrane protein